MKEIDLIFRNSKYYT